MSESYLVVELNRQPVELCKLLKIANLVGGGGEAKMVISEGYVLLNGEVEYQKRKKVYHEDVVEFNGELIQLLVNETLDDAPSDFSQDIVNSSYEEPTQHEAHIPFVEPSKIKKKPAQKKSKNSGKKASKQAKAEQSIVSTDTDNTNQPKKRRPISF